MSIKKIIHFFTEYLAAFKHYDLDRAVTSYHIPSTLHTPDQIVMLANIDRCQKELTNIFNQLQQAKTSDIIAKKSSYSVITDNVFLVSIDWAFIDEHSKVFTDFCAIYHLIIIDNKLKIINVVSHDLSNSQSLDYPFVLTD